MSAVAHRISGARTPRGRYAGCYDGLPHVLTGGALSVYADEERVESTFVVDRSAEGEVEIGEVWFA